MYCFATQDKFTRADVIRKAEQLKLDMTRFVSDLDSHRFKAQVDADRQEGRRLGLDGTPFFFINGHALSGAGTFAEFKQVIDEELKSAAAKQAVIGNR